MGKKIKLKSNQGKYTAFTCSIPVEVQSETKQRKNNIMIEN